MSHDHDDFAFEPVRGLPERLPEGERMIWQGSPQWRELAVRAYHVRAVLIYFAILMIWRGAAVMDGGGDAGMALQAAFGLVPLAAIATALLSVAAWMTARATVYTITSRRVVLRIGFALTKTINIPFKVLDNASVAHGSGRYGDLALRLQPGTRIAFLHLWPHVRPWYVNWPQPTLRAIPEVETIATLLKDSMMAWQTESGAAVIFQPQPLEQPKSEVPFGVTAPAGLPA